MAYKIKYIKNPPTADDLINLYDSELYEELIKEFITKAKVKLVDEYDKQLIRQSIKRSYLILNIPFEEVLYEIETFKSEFLNFCVERSNYYKDYEEENPDGEFPEGEELEDGDKSEVIEEHGTSKSFLLENFCEFYILKLSDKERLLHYLKTTRMPYAKKHLSEISKIYKTVANNV